MKSGQSFSLIAIWCIVVMSLHFRFKSSQVLEIFQIDDTNRIGLTNNSNPQTSHLVHLPLVLMTEPIPEIDYPGCRWSYDGQGELLISYQWGNRLQNPGTLWRNAFEDGLVAWNASWANVVIHYDGLSQNVINTYDLEDGYRGKTSIHCAGTTNYVDILANVFYDTRDHYTVAQRQGVAAHETGHGISIGHIPNDYPTPALMYKYHTLETLENVNTPQRPDIDLVNQIYPND